MGVIRLSDIVSVMKSKWTYGDSDFGYTEVFNDDHNTVYPSLLITPPTSVFPELTLNNGWEEYSFEVYFSNLYGNTEQSSVVLEKRWDNLQDLGMEWLDMFLKNYQEPTVTAMLNDESVTVERVKEVANDKLIQIRFEFTIRVFSKCFLPQSKYPSDISDLLIWLKADSGATYSIPTKKVSYWDDQSDENNDVEQTTSANQPLRYGYDGGEKINDKAFFEFDGSNDFLRSISAADIQNEFTMFFVGNSANETGGVFYYSYGTSFIEFGSQSGSLYSQIYDGVNGFEIRVNSSDMGVQNISVLKLEGTTLSLEYNASNTPLTASQTVPLYNTSMTYDRNTFDVGTGGDTGKFSGEMQEFIVFGKALNDKEVEQVKGYLNKKYRIY